MELYESKRLGFIFLQASFRQDTLYQNTLHQNTLYPDLKRNVIGLAKAKILKIQNPSLKYIEKHACPHSFLA